MRLGHLREFEFSALKIEICMFVGLELVDGTLKFVRDNWYRMHLFPIGDISYIGL